MTEHGAHHPAPTPADLLWPVLNFVLFVGLLVYFLRGPIIEYFRARAALLRDALHAGARALAEATALRAELARDVENLPASCARLRADMRAVAENEREHLIVLGRRAADRIRADARALAEQELAAARDALRSQAIEEAVREATALIRRALRPEDHDRFVRDFVAGVGAGS
jgi:F-type H+-transporting ATPase subunit b